MTADRKHANYLLTAPAIGLLFAGVYAGPANAIQDKASGLAIDPPAGFSVRQSGHPGNDVAYAVISDSGKPASSNADGVLCKLAYKAAMQNAGLTREHINTITASAERQNQVRTVLGRIFLIGKTVVFQHQDYTALEFHATPRFGPKAEDTRLMFSIIETIKGRTTFVCTTTKAEFPAALAAFRKIRNKVNVPR